MCQVGLHVIPLPAKLSNLNLHPFEVVSRYRDPHFRVGENYPYLQILMFRHI